jgi:hypothetical protein
VSASRRTPSRKQGASAAQGPLSMRYGPHHVNAARRSRCTTLLSRRAGFPYDRRAGGLLSIKPRIMHSDQVFVIGSWNNILLADVGRDIDFEHMKLLGQAHKQLLQQHPGGIATLSFVRPGVPVASSAAREESARFIKALGDSLRRTAMVLEDQGTVVQLLTTVIRGINVITRNSKLLVCQTADKAVEAIAPLVDGVPKQQAATELSRVVRAFRATYTPGLAAAASG